MSAAQSRRLRAAELYRRVKEGPAWSIPSLDEKAQQRARELYQLWSRSWILSELIDLVPELRKARNA